MWDIANDAIIAEGKRVLIDDPARFDGVTVLGVDEHCWRHTRGGDKFVTVIIDLIPVAQGTGPARLLDMIEGRSKQVFKRWLSADGRVYRFLRGCADGWGWGLRVGRVSQRWVSRACWRMMMIVLVKALMTLMRRSVQWASFLNPWLCREWVCSIGQRFPVSSGVPRGLITRRQPISSRRVRVARESWLASGWTVIVSDSSAPRLRSR